MGHRILIVDDDAEYARIFAARQRKRRPGLEVDVLTSPTEALERLDGSYDLLIVDLEMPELDGRRFLDEVTERGVDRRKVVINSSWGADALHDRFGLGECLAVISKLDRAQQRVLDMILDQLAAGRPPGEG